MMYGDTSACIINSENDFRYPSYSAIPFCPTVPTITASAYTNSTSPTGRTLHVEGTGFETDPNSPNVHRFSDAFNTQVEIYNTSDERIICGFYHLYTNCVDADGNVNAWAGLRKQVETCYTSCYHYWQIPVPVDWESGTYTVYWDTRGHSASGTKITVEESSASVTIPALSFEYVIYASNQRFVDAFGNLVDEVGIDQQVQIATDITNTLSVDQEFAYWIEYTGPTSNEMWITGSMTPGQSMSPALSWTPMVPGNYTFSIKLIDSVDGGNSLAAPLTLQINIPGGTTCGPGTVQVDGVCELVPEILIPSWIKNNAGWWADGLIDDRAFVTGLQWLISNGIMNIPETEQGAGSDDVIPDWIKNNAGWWADGLIDDRNFVTGLQWLITNGIMIIG